jgi:UDP-glucuronate decarboxylase
MGERALITGGAGFIGFHLARALVARGFRVTLVDNFFRSAVDAELQGLLHDVDLVECDLTQPIAPHMLDGGYSQIYHLAAVVGVRYSNEIPHYVLRTNLLTTIHLLDWCVEHPDARVLFSSTSEVLDGSIRLGLASIPVRESVPFIIADPALPRASYALSKMAGELLCHHYARAYRFPVRVVRLYNVYGPRMGYDHVIPQLIQRIQDRQDPFVLYGADQTRAFCHVDDAVSAMIRLMELPSADPVVANVGNDQEEIRIRDLAQQLFAITAFSPTLRIRPAPRGSPDRRCPDLTTIRQLIDYQPTTPLAIGLRQTYAWYTQQ